MTDVVQPDKKTRDKAIKGLTAFLSQSGEDEATAGKVLSKGEMAKLWKGIFYCTPGTFRSRLLQTNHIFLDSRIGFWMSDKPLVQQALATEISEILLVIPNPTSSLAFLRGFWEATVREWAGIDRLR